MARSIKFRAWHEHGKRMVYGPSGDESNPSWVLAMCSANGIEPMQFTGLKDKNGKEIYEGDIIKIFKGNFVVKWEEYQFILPDFYSGSNDVPYDYFSERSGEEVIGNIYENPELLKESEGK